MKWLGKTSSGALTADSLIYDGPCLYFGFVMVPAGADRTVYIYDNITATGTKVENFTADGQKKTDGHSHSVPVICDNGLYLDISGGTIVVYYQPTSKS